MTTVMGGGTLGTPKKLGGCLLLQDLVDSCAQEEGAEESCARGLGDVRRRGRRRVVRGGLGVHL
jgi:hypothetical protein